VDTCTTISLSFRNKYCRPLKVLHDAFPSRLEPSVYIEGSILGVYSRLDFSFSLFLTVKLTLFLTVLFAGRVFLDMSRCCIQTGFIFKFYKTGSNILPLKYYFRMIRYSTAMEYSPWYSSLFYLFGFCKCQLNQALSFVNTLASTSKREPASLTMLISSF